MFCSLLYLWVRVEKEGRVKIMCHWMLIFWDTGYCIYFISLQRPITHYRCGVSMFEKATIIMEYYNIFQLVLKFLESAEFQYEAVYEPAFQKVFSMLHSALYHSSSVTARCNPVVILFTDGDSSLPTEAMAKWNNLKTVCVLSCNDNLLYSYSKSQVWHISYLAYVKPKAVLRQCNWMLAYCLPFALLCSWGHYGITGIEWYTNLDFDIVVQSQCCADNIVSVYPWKYLRIRVIMVMAVSHWTHVSTSCTYS